MLRRQFTETHSASAGDLLCALFEFFLKFRANLTRMSRLLNHGIEGTATAHGRNLVRVFLRGRLNEFDIKGGGTCLVERGWQEEVLRSVLRAHGLNCDV